MSGFFAIGVDGISKPYNLGNLFRSANAFGASFVFTTNAQFSQKDYERSDTSKSWTSLPLYQFPSLEELPIPHKAVLVGIELVENSTLLPQFHHPKQALYVLGPERGSLTTSFLECCHHIVKIPTSFCVNVAVAGAIVMYDRLVSLGHFERRLSSAEDLWQECPTVNYKKEALSPEAIPTISKTIPEDYKD